MRNRRIPSMVRPCISKLVLFVKRTKGRDFSIRVIYHILPRLPYAPSIDSCATRMPCASYKMTSFFTYLLHHPAHRNMDNAVMEANEVNLLRAELERLHLHNVELSRQQFHYQQLFATQQQYQVQSPSRRGLKMQTGYKRSLSTMYFCQSSAFKAPDRKIFR